MSTSIAANVTSRTAPDPHISPPPPPAHAAQDGGKAQSTNSPDGVAFASPVIKVDSDTGLALLVVRNSATGEELDQYPSKRVVAEYQRVQGVAPDPSAASGTVPATGASTSDNGQSLASDAKAPPAPVIPVAAPPVSPATGDAHTTPTTAGKSGVGGVHL